MAKIITHLDAKIVKIGHETRLQLDQPIISFDKYLHFGCIIAHRKAYSKLDKSQLDISENSSQIP